MNDDVPVAVCVHMNDSAAVIDGPFSDRICGTYIREIENIYDVESTVNTYLIGGCMTEGAMRRGGIVLTKTHKDEFEPL